MKKNTLLALSGCLAGSLLLWDTAPSESAEVEVIQQTVKQTPKRSLFTPDVQRIQTPVLEDSDDEIYLADQVMVSLQRATSLAGLAGDLGVVPIRDVGPSGYGVLSVPEGMDRVEFLQQLNTDERVKSAIGNARVYGASGEQPTERANAAQWHLDAIGAPYATDYDVSEWVVAVLDTGVAYDRAPSLSSVPIVAPWDFVDNDAEPLDEHWHGTHIASIIASQGDVEGVAAGVGLMPVRVLDENNRGDEASLVDGLYWAVDNGADVINLSLSFPDGYLPSQALHDALRYARDAHVIVIGASGNHAERRATWPAASPLVITVGSSTTGDAPTLAPYSNQGVMIDIMAPGGDLDRDHNNDGWPDGILAETLDPDDPTQTGHYFATGTSQATAVVSGAVVHLLDAGGNPDSIQPMLHLAGHSRSWHSFSNGYGGGDLELQEGLWIAESWPNYQPPVYGAAIMPWLQEAKSGAIRPKAVITVVDADGNPAEAGLGVVAAMWRDGQRSIGMCQLNNQGRCTLTGAKIPASQIGDEVWAFEVGAVVMIDAIEDRDLAIRPEAIFFASDALEVAADAGGSGLSTSPIVLSWQAGQVDGLGNVAESHVIPNMGSGLSTSPITLMMTPGVLGGLPSQQVTLDLDGSGLSTSPIGLMQIRLMDGSGLSTSPILGLQIPQLALLDGSGLSTSPILGVRQFLGGEGDDVTLLSGVSLDGEVVWQSDGMSTADLDGTSLGDIIDAGGWRSAQGYEAAALLAASGAVGLGLERTVDSTDAESASLGIVEQ